MLNSFYDNGRSARSRDSDIALLDIPQPGCAPFVIGTLGAAFEAPLDVECNLTRSDERLIKELGSMLDKQLLAALDSRSASEFAKVRADIWPKYIRALRALSDTMRNVASEHDIDRLSRVAMAEFKTDLEKQRGSRFGNALTDQAIFTLWTLEKIRLLSFKLTGKPAPEQRGTDLQLNKEYRLCSLWAQFHMDVTVAAMNFDKAVPDDVQDSICDGLRSVVNAYAIMKEALELRRPRAEEPATAAVLPWDEEDEQLLATSMQDINGDFPERD
jgi:hypothetical protein